MRLALDRRRSGRKNAGTGDGISVEVDNGSGLATGIDALHRKKVSQLETPFGFSTRHSMGRIKRVPGAGVKKAQATTSTRVYGDYRSTLDRLNDKGWALEVYFWSSGCSSLIRNTPWYINLDPHFREFCFFEKIR